jgi:catechol 2,3-dioxygenase-like lactoylglutathione lyase family enzyme
MTPSSLLLILSLRSPAVVFCSAVSEPVSALEFVQSALAQHQIVFLGDIHPLAEPKLLVAELVRQQRVGQEIDLLALEVGADQQEWIDRYLKSQPEDTSVLLDHPRTLRAHWGISAEYLGIYRAVYHWNWTHPEHPVHVLAADLLGWPIAPLTAHMATGGFVNRDIWMAAAFRKTLQQHPGWRVLIFMGGYHGLKEIGGQVAIGRVHDRFDHWFAGYLVQDGVKVYTILTDARRHDSHPATRVFARLARDSAGNFVEALDSTTDEIKEPLYDVDQDGFQLEFWPSRFALRTAADAMLVLNHSTPITPLH